MLFEQLFPVVGGYGNVCCNQSRCTGYELIPFSTKKWSWKSSLHHGLMFRRKDNSIVLTGGVNDIWYDTTIKKLIVVDYQY